MHLSCVCTSTGCPFAFHDPLSSSRYCSEPTTHMSWSMSLSSPVVTTTSFSDDGCDLGAGRRCPQHGMVVPRGAPCRQQCGVPLHVWCVRVPGSVPGDSLLAGVQQFMPVVLHHQRWRRKTTPARPSRLRCLSKKLNGKSNLSVDLSQFRLVFEISSLNFWKLKLN
jgi:hypothetical protein